MYRLSSTGLTVGRNPAKLLESWPLYKWAAQCEINYRKGSVETCEPDHMLASIK